MHEWRARTLLRERRFRIAVSDGRGRKWQDLRLEQAGRDDDGSASASSGGAIGSPPGASTGSSSLRPSRRRNSLFSETIFWSMSLVMRGVPCLVEALGQVFYPFSELRPIEDASSPPRPKYQRLHPLLLPRRAPVFSCIPYSTILFHSMLEFFVINPSVRNYGIVILRVN